MKPFSNFWVGRDPQAVKYFLKEINWLITCIIKGKFEEAKFSTHPEAQGLPDDLSDHRKQTQGQEQASSSLGNVNLANIGSQTVQGFYEEALMDQKGKKGKKGKGKGKGKDKGNDPGGSGNRLGGRPHLVNLS